MGKKCELGEDDANDGGYEQLIPAVPQQHKAGDGSAEKCHQDTDKTQVVALAATEQAGIANADLQVAVVVGSCGTTRYTLLRGRGGQSGTHTAQGSLPISE